MGCDADSYRTVPSRSYGPSTTGALWRFEGDDGSLTGSVGGPTLGGFVAARSTTILAAVEEAETWLSMLTVETMVDSWVKPLVQVLAQPPLAPLRPTPAMSSSSAVGVVPVEQLVGLPVPSASMRSDRTGIRIDPLVLKDGDR